MDDERSFAPVAGPVSRGTVLGLLIALSAGLAGCDSGDSSDGATPASETPAAAEPATDTMADAAAIRERIIGNTVTGTMSPDSAYTEFYAPDGTIHGAGYEARWTIESDEMCLDYDESLQSDCYGVRIDGKTVEWHRQGEVQGTGTLVAGNPNNFQ